MNLHVLLTGAALVAAASLAAAPLALPAGQDYATPRFTDTDRRQKLESLLPEIDREFRDAAAKKNYPGLGWGLVLDGQLVHTGVLGFGDVEKKIPVAPDSRFRIASMTKSFTALAVLQLRDAGRLALHDPVASHVPEFRRTAPLTPDAPPITLRHLLTMTAGFPEDNPWGDRQLAVSVADLQAFLRDGLSLSNAPGLAFEYSNLGYALLGQVITQVAGMPYQQYITREILRPLGMNDTVWNYTAVPAGKLALGYRGTTGGWAPEPLLGDGTYGAMGGLLTTIPDFARYTALHLAAWPARPEPDDGLVRRATLREMHQPAVISRLTAGAKNLAGEPAPFVTGYGYGLRWTLDHQDVVSVGHSGGLPGFGSNFTFFPDHGVAVISFANLTYAGTSAVNARVGALLLEKARLPRRTLPAAPLLAARAWQVAELVQSWDPALAAAILAENFFLDRPREEWIQHARATLARAGTLATTGPLVAENQLRGKFPLSGNHGTVEVFFTLTPEKNPRVQELRLTFVATP